jgi:shikimate dehydrogenase
MTEDAGGLPLPIDGAARVFAILGDPIRQVQSPTEFNRLLRRLGFAGVLVPLHVSPEDLAAAVEGIRRMANFDGFIITVPHKIAMLDLVDEVLANGARVGAINAARRGPDGRWQGDNFDGAGCVRALAEREVVLAGRQVLQIGAGGVGRAIAVAFAAAGASRISLYDIDEGREASLAANLRQHFPELVVETRRNSLDGHDLVVNCTSLGMQASDPYPVDPAGFTPGMVAVEVIQTPEVSPMLVGAEAKGCIIQPGRAMTVAQMALVAEFFGVPQAS